MYKRNSDDSHAAAVNGGVYGRVEVASKATLSSVYAYWASMTGKAKWHGICRRTKHAMRAAGITSIVFVPEGKEKRPAS